MRAAYVVGAVFLVACGQEGVDIDTNMDNLCEEIAEVACFNAYNCCTESEIERILGVSEPRTQLQCQEDLTIRCERLATAVRDSLEDGRLVLDSARMNACLESIAAPDGTCSQIITDPDAPWEVACEDSPFTGQVAVMDTCYFDHDCAGYPDTAECAPNQKCIAKPVQGFPCGTGCANGFYCAANICQPRLAENSPCTSTAQCQEDLFCDTTAMPMPLCTARQGAGASCFSDAACESGDCIPGTCMNTTQNCFRDMECGSRCADDGSACLTAANCATGTCQIGTTSCTSDLNCTAFPNDVCMFPVQCLPGKCIGDPPVCTAPTSIVTYCSGTGGSALDYLPIL